MWPDKEEIKRHVEQIFGVTPTLIQYNSDDWSILIWIDYKGMTRINTILLSDYMNGKFHSFLLDWVEAS